jgi:hypothetical protein
MKSAPLLAAILGMGPSALLAQDPSAPTAKRDTITVRLDTVAIPEDSRDRGPSVPCDTIRTPPAPGDTARANIPDPICLPERNPTAPPDTTSPVSPSARADTIVRVDTVARVDQSPVPATTRNVPDSAATPNGVIIAPVAPVVVCDSARTIDGLARADSTARPRSEWCRNVRPDSAALPPRR